MKILMLMLCIGSLCWSIPTIKGCLRGNFRTLFPLMVFLDVVIVAVAFFTRSLVTVVTVQVLVSTLINLLDQRRADQNAHHK